MFELDDLAAGTVKGEVAARRGLENSVDRVGIDLARQAAELGMDEVTERRRQLMQEAVNRGRPALRQTALGPSRGRARPVLTPGPRLRHAIAIPVWRGTRRQPA